MKKYNIVLSPVGLLIPFIASCFLLTACEKAEKYVGAKTEVISYDEEIFEVSYPVNIEISGEIGNIEMYSWNEKTVKFEITKRIKGYKEYDLNRELDNFKIEVKDSDENNIFFGWKYKGEKKNRGILDHSVDVTVYLPKRVENIKCQLDIGKIKIDDDLKCNLFLELNMANIEINKFQGKLYLKGDMSNLKISEGLLSNGSEVKINMGNINIKAGYETYGTYSFETKLGNIDLNIPSNSMISFESSGYIQVNEFELQEYPTKIKLKSEMGRICINKF